MVTQQQRLKHVCSTLYKGLSVGLLAFTLAACSLPGVPTSTTDEPALPPSELERTMLSEVNAARQAGQDCGAEGVFEKTAGVRLEPHLNTAAQTHADDMNTQGYFGHTAPDGSTVGVRVSRTGYRWSRVGENIARGYKDVDTVMQDWLKSDGHCANLMNPAYREFGVGRSGDYWVQVFARAK